MDTRFIENFRSFRDCLVTIHIQDLRLGQMYEVKMVMLRSIKIMWFENHDLHRWLAAPLECSLVSLDTAPCLYQHMLLTLSLTELGPPGG